jgi:hypothetical protein
MLLEQAAISDSNEIYDIIIQSLDSTGYHFAVELYERHFWIAYAPS